MKHQKLIAAIVGTIAGITCTLLLMGGCTEQSDPQNIATIGPAVEINSAATIVMYTRGGKPYACVRFVRGLGGMIWREKLLHCPTLSNLRYASVDGAQVPVWTDPESGNTYRVETTELAE